MKQKKSNQKNEVDKMRKINRSNDKKSKKKDRLCKRVMVATNQKQKISR